MFTILFVCTGNLCRSPMAELWARAELDRRLGPEAGVFRVSSAGTGTRSGRPIAEYSAQVLATYQVPSADFRSTELSSTLLRRADLVLTATRAHRRYVVDEEPSVLKRSFTIQEFGRVGPVAVPASGMPKDLEHRAHVVVQAVARCRGTVRPGSAADDDIPDPIGRPLEVYGEVGRQLTTALDHGLTALLGR